MEVVKEDQAVIALSLGPKLTGITAASSNHSEQGVPDEPSLTLSANSRLLPFNLSLIDCLLALEFWA